MTTAPFVLTCLGFPELHGPDGKVVRIRVRKHLALLVYLAIERRRSHDRGRLVDLLWPRASANRGRHSCATALSQLRTVFGRGAFTSARNQIRFAPANLVLDLDRLEASDIIGADGEATIDVDGFLRGFDIDDSPEFGLWKEREHARRLPAIHAGLLTLIDHGRRRGSHEEIMQRAERLLGLDHLAEEGIRAKMEALALVGDRVSALRVFDEWKDRLGVELGAEPSMLVDGMASQLRKRGWEPKEPNPLPAVPAEQWRDRTFVGRKAEYRRLYEIWEAVHHYRPRHFLIVGDSGVGKTTLAQRLVTAAGLEGASVSRIQCYQMEQRIPFAAIGGLVTGLLGRPGVAATAPEALAEIGRIVPQVKTHFPNLPAPKQSEGESARLLFAEGVIDLLKCVMEERPLLLTIDDFHHADEASVAILHLVVRRIDSGRLLVVSTATIAGDLGKQAHRNVQVALSIATNRITVDPMPDADCEELLECVLGSAGLPSLPERRALVRASAGFPMVLELLAEDWRANGKECLALALRAITTDLPLGNTRNPDSLQTLADRLLADVEDSTRRVLLLSSILGPHVSDLGVYALVDLTTAQTIDGLSELTGRRILRDVGSGLEFINELLRAHVYRRIPGPLRIRLHAAVADRALSGALQMPQLELAWHLMRSRRPNEAADLLIQGGRDALLRGAPDEVVLALESSLDHLPQSHLVAGVAVLAEAFHELGRWKESLGAMSIISEGEKGSQFRLLEIEARWRIGSYAIDDLRRSVTELLAMAATGVVAPGRTASLAASIAGSILDDELLQAVDRFAMEAVGCGERESALLSTARAIAAYYRRDSPRSEQHARLALATHKAAKAGDSAVVQLAMGLGIVCSSQGRYVEALEQQLGALALAIRIGNDQLRLQATANAALVAVRLGRFDQAVELATQARGISGFADLPTIRTNLANLIYAECCALRKLPRKERQLN